MYILQIDMSVAAVVGHHGTQVKLTLATIKKQPIPLGEQNFVGLFYLFI